MNCFFTLLDHNDSIKICEPLGPEVINVECVYETCSHGVTLVAEHSNSLQTNSACVYFDVDIDDGFDFDFDFSDVLRLMLRHQMLRKTSTGKKRFLSGIARIRGGGSTHARIFGPFFYQVLVLK